MQEVVAAMQGIIIQTQLTFAKEKLGFTNDTKPHTYILEGTIFTEVVIKDTEYTIGIDKGLPFVANIINY